MGVLIHDAKVSDGFGWGKFTIDGKRSYYLFVTGGYVTVCFGADFGRRKPGVTFHDGRGRGPVEEQARAHYKRDGAVLADTIRDTRANIVRSVAEDEGKS